jgi:hypothetical protein
VLQKVGGAGLGLSLATLWLKYLGNTLGNTLGNSLGNRLGTLEYSHILGK